MSLWTDVSDGAVSGVVSTNGGDGQNQAFRIPFNGLTVLILIVLMGAALAVGIWIEQERESRRTARIAEVRRLRSNEGRPQVRHHGTAGNAKVSRAVIPSRTSDYLDD